MGLRRSRNQDVEEKTFYALGRSVKVFFNERPALVIDRKTQRFVYGGMDGGGCAAPTYKSLLINVKILPMAVPRGIEPLFPG
jgi:hypothetical protein